MSWFLFFSVFQLTKGFLKEFSVLLVIYPLDFQGYLSFVRDKTEPSVCEQHFDKLAFGHGRFHLFLRYLFHWDGGIFAVCICFVVNHAQSLQTINLMSIFYSLQSNCQKIIKNFCVTLRNTQYKRKGKRMGEMKIDMHVHTQEGSPCSRVPVKLLVDKLKEKGFDGVLLTDHESIKGFRHLRSSFGLPDDFVVLRGFECTTTLGDMLVILPTEEVIPYRDDMTPFALIEMVHEKGGVVGIAHMFRDIVSIGNNARSFEELETIVQRADFIEVENGGATADANFTAWWWAKQYFKPQTKGSDSHILSGVGKTGTVFLGDIKNEQDLIRAIQNNRIKQDS